MTGTENNMPVGELVPADDVSPPKPKRGAAACQWKAGSKSEKGKTTLSGRPEGSGGQEGTGDTEDEIEEIEEIKGIGDTVNMAADGKTAPDEAEIETQ
eukprot:jgi/Tetstr1/460956/TSEL_006108.t1